LFCKEEAASWSTVSRKKENQGKKIDQTRGWVLKDLSSAEAVKNMCSQEQIVSRSIIKVCLENVFLPLPTPPVHAHGKGKELIGQDHSGNGHSGQFHSSGPTDYLCP